MEIGKRKTRWLVMVATVGVATILVGCSGKEAVETSSSFNKLPPDVAKQRLETIMKKRGMNVKDENKYLPH